MKITGVTVYYQETKMPQLDSELRPTGVYTDIVCIYFKSTWKSLKDREREYLIQDLKKFIPFTERTYDPIDHFWTIPAEKFKYLKTFWMGLYEMPDSSFVKVKDIRSVRGTSTDPDSKPEEQKLDPEEFFYNKQSTALSVDKLPLATLRERLQAFIDSALGAEASERLDSPTCNARKLYLKTVRKLHPDLNSGDSSKMSEFNMLWQNYTALTEGKKKFTLS